MAVGKFYGVGLGPGDPELLTRKAERILAEVDWIYLPGDTSSGPGFAAGILSALNVPATKLRPLSLCMSKVAGVNQAGYRQTAAQIVDELRGGKSVAWATEGDPLFYSTFLHLRREMLDCDPEVKIEIVPGITSMQASAARLGLPVAWRDEKVAIVPAGYGIEHLPQLLAEFATVFLIKVHSVLDRIVEILERIELPIQASYLEYVGTSQERVVTDLKSLMGQSLPYFSLVILRRES